LTTPTNDRKISFKECVVYNFVPTSFSTQSIKRLPLSLSNFRLTVLFAYFYKNSLNLIKMNSKEIGVLTMVGVAAGSVAYLLYASMPQEKKRKLEDKVLNSASKFIDTIRNSVLPSADDAAIDIEHSVVDSKLGKSS
jgi:hypothetical protein